MPVFPFSLLEPMTVLDIKPQATCPEASIGVLRTERLILRAPGQADATAIARLINDRRIAENTSRIPHPYALADAHAFLAHLNRDPSERAFLIRLADGTIVGGCGLQVSGGFHRKTGYLLGVPYWGSRHLMLTAQQLILYTFTELDCEALGCRVKVSNP